MKKKLIIAALAAVSVFMLVSCVDSNYDTSKLNTESDIKVEVNQDVEDIDAGKLFNVANGMGTDDNGNVVIAPTVTESVDCEPTPSEVNDFNDSKPVALKFSGDTKVSLQNIFPTDMVSEDIFAALDRPSIRLHVSVEMDGNDSFSYSGRANGVEFKAILPGPGEYDIYLSESGNAPKQSNSAPGVKIVDAEAIGSFLTIFKGMPEFVDITDVKVMKSTAPKASQGNVDMSQMSFQMSASVYFPLVIKKGCSFTVVTQYNLDELGEVSWDDYKDARKLKLDYELTHNFPLSLSNIKVIEPEGVTTQCPEIKATTAKQTGTLSMRFEKALPSLKYISLSVRLTGTGEAVSDNMKVQIEIKNVAVTTEL